MYIAIAIFLFCLVGLLLTYNSLITYRNRASSAFSTIDVMLKKRWDLIPNLVAVAKGYMQHEATLLERIVTLRSTALSSPSQSGERLAAEAQLSNALGQFKVIAENYPNLKASENFLQLQAALNECEEQISAARRAFNAAILQYNNCVEMFPSSVVANFFHFERRAFFEILESERANPDVKASLS